MNHIKIPHMNHTSPQPQIIKFPIEIWSDHAELANQ
jgi:hypothetical protein